ncbi:MBL fold metallo-hydrolase [Candidatus Bathyarchaeota archaeon]|jgi:phosphoribosyl 1,2-cyclic phosphodiesterase|nr:MBL fold metallo-hydrolase [Candidatus Bathyarchaeota archaeon]MDP6048254.1 MBL fold metallo-hydrolase [Candidatus Bathyarchaeota archaeon]|tara:strand:- start:5241 stop:6071 length:831 start_codon:yes stop_codon:yes gene_type:complete
MPLDIYFLGTGGGRFSMLTQKRRTAGILLVHGETHVHVDPGPGALVYSNLARLDPQNLEGIVVTHCHPDHYTDAEVLIEAMSHGTRTKRGLFAAPKSVLIGNSDYDRGVSRYHSNLPATVETMKSGRSFGIDGLVLEAMEARHSETEGVGIRIRVPGVGDVGYTSDTGFFEGLSEQYRGLRILIACAMWPRWEHLRYHLNTEEVRIIVEKAKPGAVILTHFGMKMLNAEPGEEATYIEKETGIPVVAAQDGMRVIVSDRIEVRSSRKCESPRIIDA